MLASDLKLLNLVSSEHLHYNKYITMTTYANYTISKTRVNNLYVKNAFAHRCPGFLRPRLWIWAELQGKCQAPHEDTSIVMDGSGKQDASTLIHHR